MAEACSINGVRIRVTDERWHHVLAEHPELSETLERVLRAIPEPDIIYERDAGAQMAAKAYQNRDLVVTYRETSAEDGFLITAYWTRRLRPRRVIWKR